jgi:hypothetical protein
MRFRNQPGFRDSKYKAFVSGKPCLVCGRPGEAHHYGGQKDGRGLGYKCSDQRLVPLCHVHHREVERLGRRMFELRYGLEFEKEDHRLHQLFNEREKLYGNGE